MRMELCATPASVSLRRLVTRLGVLCCALVPAQHAHAQAFPSQNLRMVVPYTAGGSIDLISRVLAQKLGAA